MTVNKKIYDIYCEHLENLEKINAIKEKLTYIGGQFKTLMDQKVFNDGEYEKWITNKLNIETDLEKTKEELTKMNPVIETILDSIPLENKEFFFMPERNPRDEFTFSKLGNEFTVKRTDKYAKNEGYKPEIKKYSYTE